MAGTAESSSSNGATRTPPQAVAHADIVPMVWLSCGLAALAGLSAILYFGYHGVRSERGVGDWVGVWLLVPNERGSVLSDTGFARVGESGVSHFRTVDNTRGVSGLSLPLAFPA